MTTRHLAHRFITSAPDELDQGVLYVSIEYDTTMHLCACGCGHQVVLPLHPTAWRLSYDGDTVSMSPSVGNWSFPCRSHYWIDRGRIVWAPSWSDAEVAAGRCRTDHERGVREPHLDEARRPTAWRRIKAVTRRIFLVD